MPRLSIIIPTLNEAEGIAKLLTSLSPLRQRGHEVIVADGGSHDGTAELARPLADLVIDAPRGRAAQMNAGAAQAKSEVLLFLHADTRLPAQADELILEQLAIGDQVEGNSVDVATAVGRNKPAPAGVSGKPKAQMPETVVARPYSGLHLVLNSTAHVWGRFDVVIEGTHPLLPVIAWVMNRRSRWTGIATGDQAIFVRREVFESMGGFPDMPLMEDIALSKKLKAIGPPLCIKARVTTSGRRWERHGVISTVLKMWRLRLAFFLGADPARLAKAYGYEPRTD